MNKQERARSNWNAGQGMAVGAVAGAVVAILVNVITGDTSVWSWAIPVGLACGLAIGNANGSRREQQ